MGNKDRYAELSAFKPEMKVVDTPTSVSWIDGNFFAAGYAKSEVVSVFDVNKPHPTASFGKKPIQKPPATNGQPNRVRSSNNLIFVGYESKQVRIFDIRKQTAVNEFIAHSDAVTGLCLDNQAQQLITSGHDGNIRIWDLRTTKCLNDLKANRRKYDESILNIDMYRRRTIASGRNPTNHSWCGLSDQSDLCRV